MKYIWADDKFIPTPDAKIAIFSQTFHYGFGVYEGIRSYGTDDGTVIFRLEDHIDRLFCSADLLKIKIPYEPKKIIDAHYQLLEKNDFTDAYFRPVVFMGDEFLGLHTQHTSVHVMIAAIKWNNFFISKEQIQKGISVKTSSHERVSFKNGLNKAKANGLYLISILANNEVRSAGYDDALMLDPQGYIAEGTGSNIFMVKNNCLITPHLHFALDGITRRSVMQIARDEGIEIIEKNIMLDELYGADELFFTGTAAEVLPITTIDDRQISGGLMGSLTEKIQKQYSDSVRGKNKKYRLWTVI